MLFMTALSLHCLIGFLWCSGLRPALALTQATHGGASSVAGTGSAVGSAMAAHRLLRHAGSSLTRGPSLGPLSRWNLTHYATREVPYMSLKVAAVPEE